MGVLCKHERCTALARFEGFCPGHYATRRQRDRRSEVGTSNDREEPVCDECGRPASALKSFNRKRRMHDSCIKTRKRRAKEAAPEADGKRREPNEPVDVQRMIEEVCDEIKSMLLDKNRKYGNSALEPKRIFSKADPMEQINVRIDDKLSRIESGQVDDDEDVETDLIGYLVLKRVAKKVYG